jgi:hypothetical protein
MSYWNQYSQSAGPHANLSAHQCPLQGRFILEAVPDKSGWYEFILQLSGGIWVQKGISFDNWKGDVQVFLKLENEDEPHLVSQSLWQGNLSNVPDGALFGDSPDFVSNHTWFPIKETSLQFYEDDFRKIVSGEIQLTVQTQTLEWRRFDYGFTIPTWINVTRHILSKDKASGNQLIIKSLENF